MAQLGYDSLLATGNGTSSGATLAVTIDGDKPLILDLYLMSASGDATSSVVLRPTGGGATLATFTARVGSDTDDSRAEIWTCHAADLPAAGTYEIHAAFTGVVRYGIDCHQFDTELHATTPVRDSSEDNSAINVEPDDLYWAIRKHYLDPGAQGGTLTERLRQVLLDNGFDNPTTVWGAAGSLEITSSGTEDENWGTDTDFNAHANASFVPAGAAQSEPTVTTTTLPDGTEGTAYSETLAADADGGTPASPAWTITVGQLPAGLSLNGATGEISGTPTGLADPKVWSISAGTLPSGLSLNTATGEISGTPDTVQAYDFTLRVTDDDGNFDDQQYTGNVTGTNRNVAADAGSLSLTAFPAQIGLNRRIAVDAGALGLTTHAAQVNAETQIAALAATLGLTTHPAGITLGNEIAAALAALGLTPLAADVTLPKRVGVAAGALGLTPYPANVNAERNLTAASPEIGLTTHRATIQLVLPPGEAVLAQSGGAHMHAFGGF